MDALGSTVFNIVDSTDSLIVSTSGHTRLQLHPSVIPPNQYCTAQLEVAQHAIKPGMIYVLWSLLNCQKKTSEPHQLTASSVEVHCI